MHLKSGICYNFFFLSLISRYRTKFSSQPNKNHFRTQKTKWWRKQWCRHEEESFRVEIEEHG